MAEKILKQSQVKLEHFPIETLVRSVNSLYTNSSTCLIFFCMDRKWIGKFPLVSLAF